MTPRPRTRPEGVGRVVLGAALLWVFGLVGLPMLALAVAFLGEPAEAVRTIVDEGGVDALIRSLGLAAVGVAIGLVTGTAGGVVLARQRFRGRQWLDALVDLPLAVSPVIVGLAFVVLYGRGGWLEPVAAALGVKVLFGLPGLVLATAFVVLPFFVREVALVLEEVGPSEEDAARTLGATERQVFLWVTLPQIRGALRAATLLTVSRALGEFGAVLVLGGAIDGRTQTATTFVHTMLEERHDAGAYGMSLLLGALTVLLVQILPTGARARH
jgi:sulfate transport system permease protein